MSSIQAAINLLQQAVNDWPEIDNDDPISGADAVEWLCDFIGKAKTVLTNLAPLSDEHLTITLYSSDAMMGTYRAYQQDGVLQSTPVEWLFGQPANETQAVEIDYKEFNYKLTGYEWRALESSGMIDDYLAAILNGTGEEQNVLTVAGL